MSNRKCEIIYVDFKRKKVTSSKPAKSLDVVTEFWALEDRLYDIASQLNMEVEDLVDEIDQLPYAIVKEVKPLLDKQAKLLDLMGDDEVLA